ncbi:MAG: beta-lactamase family protein [Alphaproteobacteria bacterium]|nr:beta-lactamase family protein [Alphaproteobacteria bacterium]
MRNASFAAFLVALAIAAPARAEAPYFPTAEEWRTATPEEAGLDAAAVDAALDVAAKNNSTGVLIVRHGKIVAERYWRGWDAKRSEPIFSSSKSIVSTLIGMAIEDGFIEGVEQSASDFITDWKGTDKEAITIRHLLSMTSGLESSGGQVRANEGSIFLSTVARPLVSKPGEKWVYNTPAYRLLANILEIATGEKIEAYMARRLSSPIGLADTHWVTQTAPDGATNYYFIRQTPRDMARFGLLALHWGNWAGEQLVSAAWLHEATTPSQELNASYGYLWWLNGQSFFLPPAVRAKRVDRMMWPDCPSDMFAALGAADKKIYVVPSLDLVVVRHGEAVDKADPGAAGSSFDAEFVGRLCKAAAP